MGNTNDKSKSSSSPIKSFIPPGRNPRSKALNDMVIKAIKKIEEQNYFSNDEVFVPKTLYFEDETKTPEVNPNKEKYESTQPLYGLSSDPNRMDSGSLENVDSNTNSGAPTKTPSQNSLATIKNEKLPTKMNSARSNTSGQNQTLANKGKDSKVGNKYFVSQNKTLANSSNKSFGSKKSLVNNPSKSKLPSARNMPSARNNVKNDKQSIKIKAVLSPSNLQDDEFEGANIGINLEKLPPKKKFVIDCSIEKKLFSLPEGVQFHILSFLLEDYHRLILVSPIWYYKIGDLFDSVMVNMDNNFIKHHMNILAFKRSYFTVMPYKFNNRKAVRMDRNIVAEVLPKIVGKSITLTYSYEMVNKKGTQYKASYKFDVVAKGGRTIWIYKEDILESEEEKLALVQPIIPVCENDNIKFAINFYNMNGLANISTIEWKTPLIEEIPNIPKDLQANFLEGIDRNRICEVEELHDEWFLYKYYDRKNKIEYDIFKPHLTLKETRCAGVDMISMKSRYDVTLRGDVHKALQKLGVNVQIFLPHEEIVAEVKRCGLFYDMENFLHLRVGDKLIFYLTKNE